MPQLFKLNSKNLPLIPGEATLPEYDRSVIKNRNCTYRGWSFSQGSPGSIIRICFCGIPRTREWGICGIGLLDSDRRIIDGLVSAGWSVYRNDH